MVNASSSNGLTRVLRAEGAVVLVAAVALFAHAHASWIAFGVLFLAPDLAMLPYVASPAAGAIAYNVAHSYVGAVALTALGLIVAPALLPFGLIWVAHIAWDRMLGYGLKSTCSFNHTHLGRIGRSRA